MISKYPQIIYNNSPTLPKCAVLKSNINLLVLRVSKLHIWYEKLVLQVIILGACRKQLRLAASINIIIDACSKVIQGFSNTRPPLCDKLEIDKTQCILQCLQFYIERCNRLVNRSVQQLPISYGRPHI